MTETALRECHLPRVAPDSVLVAITGQGKTRGASAILKIEATINQHLAYLTPRTNVLLPEYLHLFLTGSYAELRSISDDSGGTKGALTCEDLKGFRIALPSLKEQVEISRWVAEGGKIIDAAIRRARREMDLIREYRTRLISDVVTGKLDVREKKVATRPKKANIHFHRSVLAAEIVDRYKSEPKFGWIKLQKAIILAERHLQLDDIQSSPRRAAAGPFDNAMMRSIHAQLERQKWFRPKQRPGGRYEYIPLEKHGGHRTYFERYWGDKREAFDQLLTLLKPMSTDQAEVVATLYVAWNDFLIRGEHVDEDMLVHEVLHNWDESKRRFGEERWRNAISWMRKYDLVPQGFGATTVGFEDVSS